MKQDPEFEDLLASIMRDEKSAAPLTPAADTAQKQHVSAKNTKTNVAHRRRVTFKPRSLPSTRTLVIALMVLFSVIGVLSALGPIRRMLAPPSPFIGRVQGVTYALYYPTKLPGGYKLELESIQQPEGTPAVVYTISNDSDGKINVSLQKKTEKINYDTLNKLLTDTRTVNTKYGSVTVGKTDVGLLLANMFIDDTWILVSANPATVTSTDIDTVVQNMIKGDI